VARMKVFLLSFAVASALMLPQAVRAADSDLGLRAIQNHDWATAEMQLLAGLQKEPYNSFLQLNLAWVYAQTGRKAEAATLYQEILRRDQDRVASLSGHDGPPVAVLAKRGLDRIR
jgi:Tfp pilus assembly protein PilF